MHIRALLIAVVLLTPCLFSQTPGWNQETATASWSGRYGHQLVEFNNELWVIAGNDTGGKKNDVWHSSDGASWTPATAGAAWDARLYPACVAFNGKLWLFGGYTNALSQNDIWSSTDGINWTAETPIGTHWGKRHSHTALVHDNKIWIFGGVHYTTTTTGTNYNDVWSSPDGVTWTRVTPAAGAAWAPRRLHTTVTFNNKFWMFGGYRDGTPAHYTDEIWSSTDGATWQQETPVGTTWNARGYHASVVYNNKAWVMGGWDNANDLNDVWSTVDGVNWVNETPANPWTGRYGHMPALFSNRVWISGGAYHTGYRTDVWAYYDGAPQITSTPPLTATAGVPYTYTVTATGTPTPMITTSPLPTWLTFDNVDTVSGTPGAADIGTTPQITVAASNTAGTDSQMFQITVDGVPPVITTATLPAATAGSAYAATITATGIPAPSFSAANLPAWLSLNPTTGELTGTPAVGDLGLSPQFDITAANGWAPDDTVGFQIQVDGVPPQFTSTATTTATVGSLYTYTAAASGIPAPTLSAGTLPGWLTFNPATGELSGTPAGTDIGPSAQIDITAANGQAPDDVQSFQITVAGIAPMFTSTPVTTATPGSSYLYTAAATGTPAPSLSVTSTLPSWLSFNATTGELSGTPGNSQAKTSVDVTIVASNGVAPDATQTFTIDVARSPDAQQSDNGNDGCTTSRNGRQWPTWAAGLLAGLVACRLRRARNARRN